MKHTQLKLATTAVLVFNSLHTLALPFNSFDPRSMAMGGTGVAVGDAATAPIYNPALLSATKKEDRFAFSLPVGVRVTDQDKLIQSVKDFQDGSYVDNFNAASTAYNNNQSVTNLQTMLNSMSTLSTQLTTFSDKAITLDGGAALIIGVPRQHFGWALYANAAIAAGGIAHYRDDPTVQAWNTSANDAINSCFDVGGNATVASVTSAACTTAMTANPYFSVDAVNGTLTQNFDPSTDLLSDMEIRGALIGEAGISLSNEFDFAGGFTAGITPKTIKVQLFEYTANINSASTSNARGSDYLAKYSKFNFDIGVAKNYENGWRTGLVIKNVIPYTLDFTNLGSPTGNQIKLKPQARIGGSWEGNWATVAMDADLTRNDPAGLDKASQFVSLGGEVRVWKLMQLRAGYRADLANSNNSVASVGLGLGFLPIDIAVAGNKNQIGASLQLAMHF